MPVPNIFDNMKSTPIAWIFSRDTAFPSQRDIFDTLRFIQWVFIDGCRVDLDYNVGNDTQAILLFVDGVLKIDDNAAIKWLSDRLEMNFMDFLANMFLDLYEKEGLRYTIDSYETGLGASFYDSDMAVVGIDFSNRTILIKRRLTSEEGREYPIEKALEILNTSWESVLKTFGVSVMIVRHKEEIIREVNRLIKDEALIDINLYASPYIRNGKYTYHIFIHVAKAEKVYVPLKVKDKNKYQFLKPYTIHSSKPASIPFAALLEYVRVDSRYTMREICYSPIHRGAFLIFLDTDIRLPIDIERMQMVFTDIWLSFVRFGKPNEKARSAIRIAHTKKAIKALIEGLSERPKQV